MVQKRYSRKKRILIAYMLRSLVFLVLTGMVVLMICGGLFIYQGFAKEKTLPVFNTVPESTAESIPVTEEIPKPPKRAENIRIILDAGHGGTDGGTYSGNVIEKDITFSVVLKLQKLLEEQGAEIILTREQDVYCDLADRTEIANNSEADLFISIHCNYYEEDAGVKGLECYYYETSETGREYAEEIINEMQKHAEITVRNAKPDTFYVLKETDIPAVLIELGYLSNKTECQKLASEEYQDQLASALAESIINCLSEAE